MEHDDHIVHFISATLIGILGAVLLALFFAGMMPVAAVEKLLPFIIGFNSALTGYNFIRRIQDRIPYRRALSVVSGMAMVGGAALILNIAFYHYTGGYIVYFSDSIFLVFVGGIFSWLGAGLAIRYFKP